MKTHLTYLGIIAVLVIGFFALIDTLRTQRNVIKQKESVISEKTAEIEYHKNENGRVVAEKVAAEASVKEFKEAYPELVKELKEELNVEMKRMKAYIRNEFEARGSGVSSITNNYYDTTTNTISKSLNYSDGYLDFNSLFSDSSQIAKSIYTYRDTITTVLHSEKKWFLGNEKLFASSSLSNPAAKIINARNLLVKERDKRWVLSAGIYGDPILRQYGVGIQFGYALLKF